ncbi:hypothetical protein ACX12M_18700 [Cellulosimicrobium cellulans]
MDLTEVRPYECAGKREESAEPDQALQIVMRESETHLEVRARMFVRTTEAVLIADYSVIYEASKPIVVDPPVKAEFVERVGVMAVYPFLREGVFAMATRLQVGAPVVGLLKAGEFSLDMDDSKREPASGE